jgi:hypothetical protein
MLLVLKLVAQQRESSSAQHLGLTPRHGATTPRMTLAACLLMGTLGTLGTSVTPALYISFLFSSFL